MNRGMVHTNETLRMHASKVPILRPGHSVSLVLKYSLLHQRACVDAVSCDPAAGTIEPGTEPIRWGTSRQYYPDMYTSNVHVPRDLYPIDAHICATLNSKYYSKNTTTINHRAITCQCFAINRKPFRISCLFDFLRYRSCAGSACVVRKPNTSVVRLVRHI